MSFAADLNKEIDASTVSARKGGHFLTIAGGDGDYVVFTYGQAEELRDVLNAALPASEKPRAVVDSMTLSQGANLVLEEGRALRAAMADLGKQIADAKPARIEVKYITAGGQ